MAGSIFLLFVIFAGCFVFFKLVKPAKAPVVAAIIATAIFQLGIWCLPLLFKAIGAVITIIIALIAIGILVFLWNKLKSKI